MKRYLLTPGPTPVPPEVLAVLSEPMIGHRTAEYRAVLGEVLGRLQQVFRTSDDVVLMTASGTAAMESAVANACSPGDRVVVVSAGNFGERWVVDDDRLRARRRRHPLHVGRDAVAEDLAARLARARRREGRLRDALARPRPASSATSRRSPRPP